jgi:hypothetical protein
MRAVSKSRSRFQALVEPLAVLLHSFDEGAKRKQFREEEPRDKRTYESLAAHTLDAFGPAIERMIKQELREQPDLLRPRR